MRGSRTTTGTTRTRRKTEPPPEPGDVLDRIRAGEDVTIRDVVLAFAAAHLRLYRRRAFEDAREAQEAQAQALVVCRRRFPDALTMARYVVRAERFCHLRGEQGRWPSRDGAPPTFADLMSARLIDAFRSGEIDRELRR